VVRTNKVCQAYPKAFFEPSQIISPTTVTKADRISVTFFAWSDRRRPLEMVRIMMLPSEQACRVRAALASASLTCHYAKSLCDPAGSLARLTLTRRELAAEEDAAVQALGQDLEDRLSKLSVDHFSCSSVSRRPQPFPRAGCQTCCVCVPWQFTAHARYAVGRTDLLLHDLPRTDDLLRSWLTPYGIFAHPPVPASMHGAELLERVVEYMRIVHVALRNTSADPNKCDELKLPKEYGVRVGVRQLYALVTTLKVEFHAPSGAHTMVTVGLGLGLA
jgi:hypothetical protein